MEYYFFKFWYYYYYYYIIIIINLFIKKWKLKKVEKIWRKRQPSLTVGLKIKETSRLKLLLSFLEANDDVTSPVLIPLSFISQFFLALDPCFLGYFPSLFLIIFLYIVLRPVYTHFILAHSLDRWEFCRFAYWID